MEVISLLFGVLAIVVIPVLFAIGMIKPTIFKRIIGKHSSRPRISLVLLGLFLCLVVLGTITEPASVKQARLDKQRANKQSALIKEQQANKLQEARAAKKRQEAALRVEIKDVTEKKPLAFAKEQRQDGSLAKGSTKTIQAGKDGEKTLTYEVTYTGGKETSRKLKSEVVTTQPVNEILSLGTYVYVAPAPAYVPTYTAPSTSGGGRTGATCRDGSHSNATGSGACSHHGGVAAWLY